jgi:pimeloyl-ACP methyl ester carboxylesterase
MLLDMPLPWDAYRQHLAEHGPPEIVLLPGFLGVDLVDGEGRRIWIAPGRLVTDDLAADLFYGALDLRAERLNPAVYGELILRLRGAGLVVHPFPFDFRAPSLDGARRLVDFVAALDRGKRYAFVSHSQGGLLAALYARLEPAWKERIVASVFLGAPLAGTFEAVDCANGEHMFVAQMALASGLSRAELGCCFRSWPGLLDMLPDPEVFAGGERAFSPEAWGEGRAPDGDLLAAARRTRRELSASTIEQIACAQILSVTFSTGDAYAPGPTIAAAPHRAAGDGTVAARTARWHGMPAYEAPLSHTLLAVDPAAHAGVVELLTTGATRLAPLSDVDRDRAVVGAVPNVLEMLFELARSEPTRLVDEGSSLLDMLKRVLDAVSG